MAQLTGNQALRCGNLITCSQLLRLIIVVSDLAGCSVFAVLAEFDQCSFLVTKWQVP